MTPTRRLLPLVLALLVGCGDASTGGSPESDVEVGDTGAPDTADAARLDGSTDLDREDVDSGVGPGLGASCTAADDCLCVELFEADSLCTQLCAGDDDCPDGFACFFVTNTGGDSTQICLPTELCFDDDGDGYGNGPGCIADDCDDDDDAINPVADERCDGVDNDCDGNIDDNPIEENEDCDPGFAGECAVGRTACLEGLLECVSRVAPADEVCDARDNDCDGATDEGDDGLPMQRDCYDGAEGTLGVGPCVAGEQVCVDGGFTGCLRQVVPGDEACDGVDNDCDGVVDEGLDGATFWPDADGDGYGDPGGDTVTACAPPAGYAGNDGDCNDDAESAHADATEIPGDGIDQDCDGVDVCWVDADGDGYHAGETIASADLRCAGPGVADDSALPGDCNDDVADIHPGAAEVVGDEIDQDCDGAELCFADADNDGYRTDATVASLNVSCGNDGEAQNFEPNGDCADGDAAIHPDAAELCDGIDNDCDGAIDNGGDGGRFWPDTDDDGFGDMSADPVVDCAAPEGHVDNDSDCDDTDGAVHPGAIEGVADGVDQDCDGAELCFADADDDGFRPDEAATVVSVDLDCADPGEAAADDPIGDCDDTDGDRSEGALEVCDTVDNDCDGLVDAEDPDFMGADGSFWPDDDFDGFGDRDATPVSGCDPPAGWVSNNRDCNDDVSAIHPGAMETPADGVDQDCDGTELCYVDGDDDGYRAAGTVVSFDLRCDAPGEADATSLPGDCNDASPLVHPGATETPGDEFDQNCDGAELCFLDADGDGWRPDATSTVVSFDLFCGGPTEATAADRVGDCDDHDVGIFPTASERPGDGVDQNCDGAELCYADDDDDGYRTDGFVASTDVDCTDPGEATTSDPANDCRDMDAAVHPSAAELCDAIDNDCDGLVDGDDPDVPDADRDGVNACNDCDDSDPGLTDMLRVPGGGVGTSIPPGGQFSTGTRVVTATITDDFPIADLNVLVNITHGWDSDLGIRLVGPDGTSVTLSFRNGGNDNNYTDTLFDDEAATSIRSGTAPFTGSFRPETALAVFDGRSAAGTWSLEIEDYIADQGGTLNGWELQFGLQCQ